MNIVGYNGAGQNDTLTQQLCSLELCWLEIILRHYSLRSCPPELGLLYSANHLDALFSGIYDEGIPQLHSCFYKGPHKTPVCI